MGLQLFGAGINEYLMYSLSLVAYILFMHVHGEYVSFHNHLLFLELFDEH